MERLYSCVTVSLRCDDRPHRTLSSSERHHPVINDAEDVPPALFARIGIRMAGKTLCPALPDFRKLAIVDFLDKAASTGLIHNKPQSATS
jgi:hypothetical protein